MSKLSETGPRSFLAFAPGACCEQAAPSGYRQSTERCEQRNPFHYVRTRKLFAATGERQSKHGDKQNCVNTAAVP